MLRIIMLTVGLFLGGNVAEAATVAQVTTGVVNKERASTLFNQCYEFSYYKDPESGEFIDGSMEVKWIMTLPICKRAHWVIANSDPEDPYTPAMSSVIKLTQERYQRDPDFAWRLDQFESQLVSGALDDDPFISDLRARLPRTQTAERKDGNCLACGVGVPLTTTTSWCEHIDGYAVVQSEQKCRENPDLIWRSETGY